ncbi:PP2C family protein-serine/threonine phosphatase [Kitasatospora nipponensis]|uniref:PP2C family protein-serine/threonine phosphatase n=1 Tax=Kitasatospora nipponensis TaxID=258049 RepID=UPI0031DA7771
MTRARPPHLLHGRAGARPPRTPTADEPADHGWPPRWAMPLPWLVIVAAVVLELATPVDYSFSSLLSASTPLAALLYRPRWTIAVAVASIAAFLALWPAGQLGAVDDPRIPVDLSSLVLVAGLAVWFCFAKERIEHRLRRVQAVAEAAQYALLRPLPRSLGPVRMAGFYRAADAEALVGGDLYSTRKSRYGVRVIVGDVRGKGIGAVTTVATVLSTFREAALVQEDLTAIADRIEQALVLETSTSGDAELFVTAVLLEFPVDRPHAVRVLNRGHPPVLVLGPDGAAPIDAPFGLPLGLGDLLRGEGGGARGEVLCPLPADRLLIAYSDGITEAANPSGVFYPLASRLTSRFGLTPVEGGRARVPQDVAPERVAAFVEQDVARWAPRSKDDMVTLVLCRPDPADPPRGH